MSRPLGIVLLDNMEKEVIEEVVRVVSRKLGVNTSLLGRAECRAGFDRARRQWRADIVVNQCMGSFSSSERLCVGLTGVDLYAPPLNFVFGLALRSEGLAIVSWYRLRNKDDVFVVRLAKEVIHEVGHLEGLDHCSNESCVMWFSNTLGETDRKGQDFCPSCIRKRI